MVTLRSRNFAMFCNENTPFRKLSSESDIITWSSLKPVLFIFAVTGIVVRNAFRVDLVPFYYYFVRRNV